jgi:uncharacterized Zn finger protein
VSSIVGAKAISLASTPGAVTERPHARVFAVKGSAGRTYTVVVGARGLGAELTAHGRDICTCPAGQAGSRCSHTAAARLVIDRELRAAREAGLTAAEYHELRNERPAL